MFLINSVKIMGFLLLLFTSLSFAQFTLHFLLVLLLLLQLLLLLLLLLLFHLATIIFL